MAEDPKATGGADKGQNLQGQGAQPPNPQDVKPQTITMTQEELDKRLQVEADKRVSEAIKTAQTKWERDYDKRVKAEREEADRLARMSEEERQKAQDKKREEDLARRERTLQRKELQLEAVAILDKRKLPVSFAAITPVIVTGKQIGRAHV